MVHTIYFDESGFTGSDLFDFEQTHFVFCGGAINEEEAKNALSHFSRQPNQRELKASRLLQKTTGKNEIFTIFDKCVDVSYFVIYDKKYSATSLIYEYFIEPILRQWGAEQYTQQFHRFVSGHLYLSTILQKPTWMIFWSQLRDKIKGNDPFSTELFNPFREVLRAIRDDRDPTRIIFEIILGKKEVILSDLESISKDQILRRWLFDITLSALHSACYYFNEIYDAIVVICDESKPLRDSAMKYYDMVTGKIDLGLKQTDPHFVKQINLVEPISLKRSVDSSGIQVADIMAGAVRHIRMKPDDPWSNEMVRRYGKRVNHREIMFSKDDVDLEGNIQARRNFSILIALLSG